LQQLAIRYADQCITVTEALRRRLAEAGANSLKIANCQLKIENRKSITDKVAVVRNVPDDTTFYYDSNSKKHNFGSRFTLITHGIIEQRYGQELIVRAVCDLKEKLPDLQLEIVGDGEYRKEIEKLVSELKCERHVHFSGYLPTAQLLERLRGADVGIVAMHLSPYSELIDTNKMYEYMALRKAIIISRLAPVEEVLDESSARFFEPGDYKDLARCVADLYHNPALRRELAENAYRRYQQICWKKNKDMYTNLVENLVRRRRHWRA
jgi:glycosyltransferase involved in cell wall biosynthesis